MLQFSFIPALFDPFTLLVVHWPCPNHSEIKKRAHENNCGRFYSQPVVPAYIINVTLEMAVLTIHTYTIHTCL